MILKSLLRHIMYRDKATVYRATETEEGFVNDYEDVVVYENIPCKLSQGGNGLIINQSDMVPRVTENLKMSCDPEYDIQPNDYVVIQHEGQVFKLNASKSFQYPTHREIGLRRLTNQRAVGV